MTFLLWQAGKLTVPPVLQRDNDQCHASAGTSRLTREQIPDSQSVILIMARNHSKSATDKITFGLGCCLRTVLPIKLTKFGNRAIDNESNEE